MAVYSIDPISDPRWADLLTWHSEASVFHTPAWLRTLHDTYGYKSRALTTTAPGKPLKNGIVFCEVRSWLTGSRLVSLPFADHCQPLVNSFGELEELLRFTQERLVENGWKYVELRPLHMEEAAEESKTSLTKSSSFAFHRIDVRPDLDALMRSFHRTSIREVIRRAKREGITVESGRSEPLLNDFNAIRLITRRRQKLPPQPMAWYRNLMRHFGNDLVIWVAYLNGQPIGGLLTITCKDTLVFKHGGADERFNNLGTTPYIYWHAIQHAKSVGADTVDFGRSDLTTPGLILFKDRWGAAKSSLTYYRFSRDKEDSHPSDSTPEFAKKIFSALPDFWLSAAGRVLYRHIG